MSPAITSLVIASALVTPALSQKAPPAPHASALIVFDASGSMWGQIKGKPKIEIARDVVRDLVRDLPSDTELGLVTACEETGPAEIRYMNEDGNVVLARIPITVIPAEKAE